MSDLSVLDNKCLVAIGDSLLRGDRFCVGNTWLEMLARKHDMKLFNHGINGNTVAVLSPEKRDAAMCRRYALMEDGADYVVFLGGANDKRLNVPLGDDSSLSEETFCGALNILIAGLTEKYPRARMLFMTNYNRWPEKNKIGISDIDYVLATERVCRLHSVPCFNNYYESGISFQNPAQLKWIDEGLAAGLEQPNHHFSKEAYEWLMPKYEALLASL